MPSMWGLGTWEPPTQQAGVESESPRPPSGGKFGPLLLDIGPDPSRAKRARKRKAAKPNRLDLSFLAPKVTSRKSRLSLCLIIPSPLALSPLLLVFFTFHRGSSCFSNSFLELFCFFKLLFKCLTNEQLQSLLCCFLSCSAL